jgi:glucans biosynthesis protein C
MLGRLYSLDFLRAVLMLLGILLHIISFCKPEQSGSNGWWSNAVLTGIYEVIHNFRMPLFYLLSGYVNALLFQKLGPKTFLQNRMQRVGLVFFLGYLTISLLTQYLRFIDQSLSPDSHLTSVIYGNTIVFLEGLEQFNWEMSHLWFLYYLLLIIPCFLILRFLLAECNRIFFGQSKISSSKTIMLFFVSTSVVLLAILLMQTGYADCPTPYQWQVEMLSFFFYFYFFLSGWLLFKFAMIKDNFKKVAIPSLLVGVMLTFLKLVLYHKFKQVHLFWPALIYVLAIWCYIIGCIGLVNRFEFSDKSLIRYGSEACYWIYLTHLPFIYLLKIIFYGKNDWHVFILALFLTPIVCLTTYHKYVRSTWVGVLLNGKKQEGQPVRGLVSKRLSFLFQHIRIKSSLVQKAKPNRKEVVKEPVMSE